jgi:hypothetical protein
MLWPPPTRGERVALACGCRATVLGRVPLLFIYSIRFVEKDPGSECRDVRHLPGRRKLVTLESLVSGAGSEPTV